MRCELIKNVQILAFCSLLLFLMTGCGATKSGSQYITLENRSSLSLASAKKEDFQGAWQFTSVSMQKYDPIINLVENRDCLTSTDVDVDLHSIFDGSGNLSEIQFSFISRSYTCGSYSESMETVNGVFNHLFDGTSFVGGDSIKVSESSFQIVNQISTSALNCTYYLAIALNSETTATFYDRKVCEDALTNALLVDVTFQGQLIK